VDEAQLVAQLAELTGSLSPAEGTEALDQACRMVAEALLNGQSEPFEDPPGPASMPTRGDISSQPQVQQLRRTAADALSTPRDLAVRVFRRSWPLLSNTVAQSVPPWACGWVPASSFGPFESDEGGLVWFDVRRTEVPVRLIDAQTERPLISLPPATLPVGRADPDATVLKIPAGSVWLAAALFDPASPPGSFAGLRIRGGTLTLSHPPFIHGNAIRVAPGIVVTLQLQLEPPDRLPRSRHGGDARKVSADLPEQATFTLAVGVGGKLVQLARASLEVYGSRLRLRHVEGAAPRFDHDLARLWFPMSSDQDALSIDEASSRIFRPSGDAAILEAGWAVPVAVPKGGDPSNLGAAAGAGTLALSLAKGLHAILEPAESGKSLPLDSAFLLAEPGCLSVLASSASARYRRVLELWENGARGRSRLELQADRPLLLRFDATTAVGGAEALAVSGLECTAQLDRPVTAAGERVPVASRRATLNLQRLANITRVAVAAPADPPRDPITSQDAPQPGVSFALSNAFARTSAAQALLLNGVLDAQHQVERGRLALRFGLGFLLPSLPDPYAANTTRLPPRREFNLAFSQPTQTLAARVRWITPANPDLSFELGAGATATPGFLRIDDAPIEREQMATFQSVPRSPLPEVEAGFPRATGQGPELFRLLDVSSRADLFGVGYSPPSRRLEGALGATLQLSGMELTAPVRNVSAFTLPAFQWEPVYDLPAEGTLPFPPKLVSPTDGGPARFAMPAATLVPVAPIPVIDTLLTEYDRRTDLTLAARFTLPFGMVAVAELRRPAFDPTLPIFVPPQVVSVRPDFPASGLSGGQQLALHAQRSLFKKTGAPPPGLPGATVQTNNGITGFNVLKSGDVDGTFNKTFAGAMKMVPIQRIDFSGYGASTFSDWRRTDAEATGVTQVKFEALVGRTSREVVQIRSRLIPCAAFVVRIITMERTGSGGVFRRDSGWQPVSDGDYKLGPGVVVHPGVAPRLTNIRRIRDTSNVYEHVGKSGAAVKLVQVVFDADVEVEGVTLGANGERLVPARDQVGYVQVAPVGSDGSIVPLSADELEELIGATGPIGGPIDCELNVAQSGLHMRLSRIEVDRTITPGGSPEFVLAARGSAELSGAGQWTFARRGPSEPEPHRLDPNRPIPLIRANPVGGIVPPYRFADPSELYRTANPHSDYGLLFSAGAQRMLLPQPQVRWGDATVHGGSALLFADMYTLGGGVTLFPRPDQCHPLPAGSALRITGRRKMRLDIPAQPGNPGELLKTGEFKAGGPPERTLSEGAALRVRSRFQPNSTITLVIDSDQRPDWSCTYGPVALVSDIGDFEELMQVVGDMSSSAEGAPELRNPQMVFGGPLAPVQAIISFLTAFGLPFPFVVSLTNSKYAFKAGAKYTHPRPGLEEVVDEAIKHGAGVMLHLELAAGFGKEDKKIGEAAEGAVPEALEQSSLSTDGWHSYFECSAKLLSEVVKLVPIFVGGAAKFEIEAKSHGTYEVTIFLGVAGVVELGGLKLAKFSGGRAYSAVSQFMIGEKKVGLGFASEWELEGVFLRGLAVVKVSFELLSLLEITPDFQLEGEATLAIDVTLGWVFSKTFEVEFEMSETIAAAAFAAKSILPGVA
jgi:hypothetical protein